MEKKVSNKKTQVLLLLLVIVIWGAVAIRFYLINKSSINSDSPTSTDALKNDKRMKKSTRRDSFALYLDYQDPFLSEVNPISNNFNNKRPNKKSVRIDKASSILSTAIPQVDLTPTSNACESISLLGIMVSSGDGSYIAKVRIKDKSYSMRKGDIVNGVNVVDLNKTQIKLIINKITECTLTKN
jgi:hypothetical protein